MHQLQEIEKTGLGVMGHIKIQDPESGEVFVDKRNAINYENMSVALAHLLANLTDGDTSCMVCLPHTSLFGCALNH